MKAETRAALEITAAIGEAIKGLGSVPSGHLYARVMDKMTLQQYNKIIDLLKKSELVKESNHVLTWIG